MIALLERVIVNGLKLESLVSLKTYLILAAQLYCAVEVAFFFLLLVVHKTKMSRLSMAPIYVSRGSECEPHAYIKKILTRIESIHGANTPVAIRSFLSGWCLNAPFRDLKQDNIAEFLSWACYNSHLPELSGAQRAHIADFFTYIEAKHGVVLPKGINSDVKCVQLSLEPVTYIHRPLLMYVGVFCLELVMQFTLYFVGFSQKTTSAGLCYWFRPATDTASNPLLFFHGIAPGGPLFYLPMLFLGLLRNSTRAVYLFSNPAVAMKGELTPPSEFETVTGVLEVIDHYTPGQKVVLVGHSLGSCPVTWLTRSLPHRLAVVLLLDPVTLFLSHPAVAVNFVYKSAITKVTEAVIYLGASTEPYIAHYLKRHFWWYRNELWVEDIASDIEVVVMLSMADEIVDSPLVADGIKKQRTMIEGGMTNVKVVELAGHHAKCVYTASTWGLLETELRAAEKRAAGKLA